MGYLRSLIRSGLYLGAVVAALVPLQSQAVIYADNADGSGHITSTGAGGGWNYVGAVAGAFGDASGVYLGSYGGSYWVLTANHVGSGTFTSNSISYNVVSGSGVQVAGVDLYVFKIQVNPGDTNLLTLGNLALSSSAPAVNSTVTMIGYGRDRAASATTWHVDVDTNPYTWSESAFAGEDATVGGYKWGAGSTKRWGNNTIDSATTTSGTSYLITDFDAVVGESQVALGDSGGGMFYNNGGVTELAGILDLQTTYSGQPDSTAVFGNQTYAVDISQYRSDIMNVISVPEPGTVGLTVLGLSSLAFLARRKLQARVTSGL